VLEGVLGSPLHRVSALAVPVTVLCAVALGFAAAGSVQDVRSYPGEDVRSKVTSARAMLRGLNPYAYEVGPETSEQLIDYTRPWAKMADMHKTPTMLLLYAPTSSLPWRSQRLFWMVVEWAALCGSILLLVRCAGHLRHRLLFLALACLSFANAYLWRLHVERGQDYVFYAFLQALGAFWCVRRNAQVPAGVSIGVAIALRPTLLALVPVLWVTGLRRMAYAAFGAAALILLATLPVVGMSRWTQFRQAVAQLEQIVLGNQALEEALGLPYRPPNPVVEGYDYSVRTFLPSQSENLTFTNLGATVMPRFFPLPSVLRTWPTITKGVAVLAVLAFSAWACYSGGAAVPARVSLALAVLTGLSMDYILGVVRSAYQDVVFLVPLALMLPILVARRTPRVFALLVLCGLIVSGSTGWVRFGVTLRSATVFGGLVLCTAWACWKRAPDG
jgi:hypothetical protein